MVLEKSRNRIPTVPLSFSRSVWTQEERCSIASSVLPPPPQRLSFVSLISSPQAELQSWLACLGTGINKYLAILNTAYLSDS